MVEDLRPGMCTTCPHSEVDPKDLSRCLCHRNPPLVLPGMPGQIITLWPTIERTTGWCSEHPARLRNFAERGTYTPTAD